MADTLSSSAPASTKTEFVATCHCGRVRVKFWADPKRLVAWDCDCSDCKMRQNVHLVVPKDCFRIDMDEALEEATTLYQWGTKTAVRRFCKTCGIMPYYQPRSNPDGYGITVHCVDWTKGGTLSPPPQLTIHKYDGVNWEQTYERMKGGNGGPSIIEESKAT